jgi:chromosome segregation ATPase
MGDSPFLSNVVVPLAASLAAILAWIAKIRWSAEYRQLAEQRLEVVTSSASERVAIAQARSEVAEKHAEYLEREVRSLVELQPAKILEHFGSMRDLDQQRILELEALLAATRSDVVNREHQIEEIHEAARAEHEHVQQLREYLEVSQRQIAYLEEQLGRLRDHDNDIASAQAVLERPEFPMDVVRAYLARLDSERNWKVSPHAKEFERRKQLRRAQERKVEDSVRRPATRHQVNRIAKPFPPED